MEQYEDIKNELQQELQDLQQNVEQHSSFNKDVWRRAVKRYTRSLYRQNIHLGRYSCGIASSNPCRKIVRTQTKRILYLSTEPFKKIDYEQYLSSL